MNFEVRTNLVPQTKTTTTQPFLCRDVQESLQILTKTYSWYRASGTDYMPDRWDGGKKSHCERRQMGCFVRLRLVLKSDINRNDPWIGVVMR